jgi:hypothetical protein
MFSQIHQQTSASEQLPQHNITTSATSEQLPQDIITTTSYAKVKFMRCIAMQPLYKKTNLENQADHLMKNCKQKKQKTKKA